ncbi:MAG: nuclear transport factor 2 family protein [Dehalococcoidia bacterium]
MHPNIELVRRFHEAQRQADAPVLMGLLADDAIWHVPSKNLLSRDYHGRAEVAGFFGKARELSGGTVRTELIDVLGGDDFAIALVRVFAEREGKKLSGEFQAFTYRIESGKIAEFWFLVEDRYAVDAFWS